VAPYRDWDSPAYAFVILGKGSIWFLEKWQELDGQRIAGVFGLHGKMLQDPYQ
jgi:hypothetical protein